MLQPTTFVGLCCCWVLVSAVVAQSWFAGRACGKCCSHTCTDIRSGEYTCNFLKGRTVSSDNNASMRTQLGKNKTHTLCARPAIVAFLSAHTPCTWGAPPDKVACARLPSTKPAQHWTQMRMQTGHNDACVIQLVEQTRHIPLAVGQWIPAWSWALPWHCPSESEHSVCSLIHIACFPNWLPWHCHA